MQPGKNTKLLINYFLGPAVFCWLAFSIYQQIKHQPQLGVSWLQIKSSLASTKILYLIGALALMPVNWGIEAVKWQWSVAGIYPLRFLQAFKAVLSGVSFSVSTPNRVGEYLGRILYMPEGMRLKTVSVTVVSSFAQLLVTFITGLAGLLALKNSLLVHFAQWQLWYTVALCSIAAATLLLLLLYFNVKGVSQMLGRRLQHKKLLYLTEAVAIFDGSLLAKVLLLSFIRYGVFMLQYVLMFYLFEVNVAATNILLAMNVAFLVMAIIPSVALIEVGIRGEVTIQLMAIFSANTLGIGLASVTIWFVNLIIPAGAGSLLLLQLKAFKRKAGTAAVAPHRNTSIAAPPPAQTALRQFH